VTTLVALLVLTALDGGVEPGVITTWPSAAKAWAAIDLSATDVLAVGEYHETTGAPKVTSAIAHFTRELLPLIAPRPTSLVVETWMVKGTCGAVERQATAAVEKTTGRPASTEDEVTTLLDRSYAMGVKNHILVVGCDDYRAMLDDAGELDPAASLLLVRHKVEARAVQARDDEEAAVPGKLLLLYGGALHNDLAPVPPWEPYSFGPALSLAVGGRYTEVDLLVPEYVEGDEDLAKAPWFAPAMALAKSGKTVLVHPTARVWLVLFAATRRPHR
jgi:hypothetical protein